LTYGFDLPAILDLKIGRNTWGPDATPDKIEKMGGNDKSTTSYEYGSRLTGYKCYDRDGKAIKVGKDVTFAVRTKEDYLKQIACFFSVGKNLRRDVIEFVLPDVVAILEWFKTACPFSLYSASLLFVYDAKNSQPHGRVKIIDFAHVFDLESGARDQNFIFGLEKLVGFLKELTADEAELSRETRLERRKKQKEEMEKEEKEFAERHNKRIEQRAAKTPSYQVPIADDSGDELEEKPQKPAVKKEENSYFDLSDDDDGEVQKEISALRRQTKAEIEETQRLFKLKEEQRKNRTSAREAERKAFLGATRDAYTIDAERKSNEREKRKQKEETQLKSSVRESKKERERREELRQEKRNLDKELARKEELRSLTENVPSARDKSARDEIVQKLLAEKDKRDVDRRRREEARRNRAKDDREWEEREKLRLIAARDVWEREFWKSIEQRDIYDVEDSDSDDEALKAYDQYNRARERKKKEAEKAKKELDDADDEPFGKTKQEVLDRREKYRPLVQHIMDTEGSVLHSLLRRPASERVEIRDTVPSRYNVFWVDPAEIAAERAAIRYGKHSEYLSQRPSGLGGSRY